MLAQGTGDRPDAGRYGRTRQQANRRTDRFMRYLSVFLFASLALIAQSSTVAAAPLAQTTATCDGTLFRDDNGNGAFDVDEPAVPGGSIEIHDRDGNVLGSSITDGDGAWSIADLPLNAPIRLRVVGTPGGLKEGPLGPDSDGFLLFTDSGACTDLTIGSLLASVCSDLSVEVGNRIWMEEKIGGAYNGIQDAGEQGIAGVTVNLYLNDDTTAIDTVVTDADGVYLFKDLDPNVDYDIRLDNPADYLTGAPLFETFLTTTGQGDFEIDSNGVLVKSYPHIDLTSGPLGSSNHSYDIGFVPPATIGDLVWYDLNGNGTLDTYNFSYDATPFKNFQGIDFTPLLPATGDVEESGIAGVSVKLLDLDAGSAHIDTAVTDATGAYRFRPLPPGNYRVEIDTSTLPTGLTQSFDPDASPDHGTNVIGLAAGDQFLTADFGYAPYVDMGVIKAAVPTTVDVAGDGTFDWTIDVTNQGSATAPGVVLADRIGDGSPLMFSRIFSHIFFVEDADGYPSMVISDVGTANSTVTNWFHDNVTITAPGWACDIAVAPLTERTIKMIEKLGYADGSEGYFRFMAQNRVTDPLQVSMFCELDSALGPGAGAPQIQVSVADDHFEYNTEFDTTPFTAKPYHDTGFVNLVQPSDGGNFDVNGALVQSSFGPEIVDNYPNQSIAQVSINRDMQIVKTLLNAGQAPFGPGDTLQWQIVVTNNGPSTWDWPVHFLDELPPGNIDAVTMTAGGDWLCVVNPRSPERYFGCSHPAVAGGIASGASLPAITYESTSNSFFSPTDNEPLVNTATLFRGTQGDDNDANNISEVPYTIRSASFTPSKEEAIEVSGRLKWTVTFGGSTSQLNVGESIIVQEKLNGALVSYNSQDGWICDPYPNPRTGEEHWQWCAWEKMAATPTTVPSLVIVADADGTTNTACASWGVRNGPADFSFGRNANSTDPISGYCKTSPTYGSVPGGGTDLHIEKSHGEPSWDFNNTYVWTVTISHLARLGINHPDVPIVTDQLPRGVDLVDVRNSVGASILNTTGNGWSCELETEDNPNTPEDETKRFTCIREGQLDVDGVAGPASDSIQVVVTVNNDAAGFVTNSTWVRGQVHAEPAKDIADTGSPPAWVVGDPGIIDNDTTDTVPLPGVDLRISKTHSGDFIAGVPMQWVISAGNNNDFSNPPLDTTPLTTGLPLPFTVTDNIPAGLVYNGYSGSGWSCNPASGVGPVEVTCQYGTGGNVLAPGQNAPDLTLTTTSPNPGLVDVTNSAAVTASGIPIIIYSGTPDDVIDQADILVPFVVASKTSSRTFTIVGDPATNTFDFTLNVSNAAGTGPAPAPVIVTDTVPDAFNITNVDDGGDWDCSASSGQTVSCTYASGDFPVSGTSDIIVSVQTADNATAGRHENTMTISHGAIQQINSVLTSSVPVDVFRYAELAVAKTRDIAEPIPGDTVIYNVVVTNTGPSSAANVTVIDTLPYDSTYVDNAGSSGDWGCSANSTNPQKVTCVLTPDLPGQTTLAPTLKLRVLLGAGSYPGVTNFVTVTSDTETVPGSTVPPYTVDEFVAVTGCFGDYVWNDEGADGVLDGTGPGPDTIFNTADDLFFGPLGFQNTELSLLWAGTDGQFGTSDDVDMGQAKTSSVGYYNFNFLPMGNYRVTVDQSTGTLVQDGSSLASYSPSYDLDSGTTNPDAISVVSLTLDSQESRFDADFGFFDETATPSSIGNYVWVDEDSDGYQDAGEPGVPGVTVVLYDGSSSPVATTVTDAHGGYLFDNLAPGTYYVDVQDGTGNQPNTLPNTNLVQTPPSTLAGQDFGNQDHSSTGVPSTSFTGYPVVLKAGEENHTADFGYNYNSSTDVNTPPSDAKAVIGDRIWIDSDGDGVQDPNEIGVSGVTVSLLTDDNGDGIYGGPGDTTAATRTTDATGNYLFENLDAGAYVVQVTSDSGASHDVLNTTDYTQTGDPDHFGGDSSTLVPGGAAGDNLTTVPVVVAPGDVFLNADFGYQPVPPGGKPPTVSSIGDMVWFDADADGTLDGNEVGIPGVSVSLIQDSNANGQWDMGEPIIATDITDEDGLYLFESLPVTDGAGTDDYLVWVNDTDNVLGELDPTYDDDGGNVPAGSGAPLGVATSSQLGISAVTDLTPIAVLDQDFGYAPAGHSTGEGLIGDTLWLDTNDSGGATQEDGEPGIEGVVVELLDGSGSVIATTTTDENGHYSFGGLTVSAGGESYQVSIPASNFASGGVLEGLDNTYLPSGGTDNGTSGTLGPQVTLTTGNAINLDQDLSYHSANGTPGRIGNLIWLDADADGVWDGVNGSDGIADTDDDEPPIAGVTVDLYRDLDGNGQVDPGEPRLAATISTDTLIDDSGGNMGNYLFAGLPVIGNGDGDANAEFVVDVSDRDNALAGYWHSPGSANVNNNSQVDPDAAEISAGSPDDLRSDFGYYTKPAAIGNFVWVDDNRNGIQDPNEGAIDGVQVKLTITYPNTDSVEIVTLTGDDPATSTVERGWYSFGSLLADEDYNGDGQGSEPGYSISVNTGQAALAGLQVTLLNVGGDATPDDDAKDADNPAGVTANATQGQTNTIQQSVPTNEPVQAHNDFGFHCDSDWGDLPGDQSYPVVMDNDGGRHCTTTGLTIGNTVTVDSDGQPHPQADKDLDEGVNWRSHTYNESTQIFTLNVTVINNTNKAAQLVGWIDFDEDGNLNGANERSLPNLVNGTGGAGDSTFTTGNIPPNSGTQMVTLRWENVDLNLGEDTSTIFSRFRLTYDPSFFSDNSPTPDQWVNSGEVEDYVGFGPLSVTITYVDSQRSGDSVEFIWETATETGNAGFNLYMVVDDTLVPVNRAFIPSSVIDSVTPVYYSYQADATGERYYIEMINISGGAERYGPFDVGAHYGAPSTPAGMPGGPIFLPVIMK